MAGQLSIDGLEVRHKDAKAKGSIEIPVDLLPDLLGGRHVRVVVTARVGAKTARFKRDAMGDDYAEQSVTLELVETRSVKLVTVEGQEPASAGAPDAPDQEQAKPKRGRKLASVPPADPPEPPVE